MPTALEIRAGELKTKREALFRLFAEHKMQDGTYDFTATQRDEVKALNDELTELGKEYDQLRFEAALEESNKKALDELNRPSRPIPPPGLPSPAVHGVGVRHGGDGAPAYVPDDPHDSHGLKSLGDLFVDSPAYKSVVIGGKKALGVGPSVHIRDWDLKIHLKTLMTTTAGWAPETTRARPVVLDAQRPIRLLDVIPVRTTNQAAIVYMEETTFTNNAAETAEGGTYPEAALALTEQTSPVRKVAVFLPITDEQLEDEPGVREYVESRLSYMLRNRLETQLIAGNGTAPNLRGFLNIVGIQTQAKGADPVPDAVYKAMTKIRVTAFADPNLAMFHPNDWQEVRLLRTTDGLYIWGNPSESGPERIWGINIVQSVAMTENTGLVLDTMFTELAYRRGIDVQITNSHGTYFIEGKQAIRADLRAAVVVYRPEALCQVTGI